MKTLVNILIVVAVIAGVSVLTAMYILVIISNVTFKPFTKEDILGIKISDLENAKNSKIKSLIVRVNSCIENANKFDINFSDLFVQIFYNNELVASNVAVDTNKYTIPGKQDIPVAKNGKKCFMEDIQVFINPSTAELLAKIALKETVEIGYKVDVKIFGVKIGGKLIPSIKGKVTI